MVLLPCGKLPYMSCFHTAQDICIVELREPSGWIKVPLSGASLSVPGADRPMQAFFYQVRVCCVGSCHFLIIAFWQDMHASVV